MKVFITGGAGFIGSNLTKNLLKKNHIVYVYDNFTSGKKEYLPKPSQKLNIITGDTRDTNTLQKVMKGFDIVYHFAANSDVRKGSSDTSLDLEQNTLATHSVLEAMRVNKIKTLVFPSSMTVYGNVHNQKVSESFGPCLPISLYAASKLANEGMISAYCNLYGIRAYIFRFANVIGMPSTHGVIHDLVNKLLKNSKKLEVLGNGLQEKPYVYIDDACSVVEFALRKCNEKINLFNVGPDDTISVRTIVKIILSEMKLKNVQTSYAVTSYGWKGDVPRFKLDSDKILKKGFSFKDSSTSAVRKTVQGILKEKKYIHAKTS